MGRFELNEIEIKGLVKQHWNARAAEFDQVPQQGLHNKAQHQGWLHIWNELTGDKKLRVLDLGCGTGFLSLMLAELGHQVTGVDFAQEMLSMARWKAEQANLSIEFRFEDAESLHLPDGGFDLVVARHLIWTLPNPAKAMGEWWRMLKPDGRIALVEGQWDHQDNKSDYELIRGRLPFYSGQPSDQLAALLKQQGFTSVIVEPLMDAALWGETPTQDRYIVIGQKRTKNV
ncbi:class I SAM-dependent methyltransferase [Paenibacillus eucommiae]|uniref:Ubiquinone/menaquinone biosynthesis C-methylase UbiE n=1 Tax=Paenibacillus eucommiae TaxID=1355755 RepID=A0ABS4J216_9BACL|nr:class I SAM-dependent methyltransferase [Paenibacillus eucommiae]MBP1993355.1 ubiquinone/menaquinone biosynthesis C-methylase UbiE [Paenibacillus eucommiae]